MPYTHMRSISQEVGCKRAQLAKPLSRMLRESTANKATLKYTVTVEDHTCRTQCPRLHRAEVTGVDGRTTEGGCMQSITRLCGGLTWTSKGHTVSSVEQSRALSGLQC